ncbi:hypothetical protein [Pseudofrankia saprophytica]|uniref:hypothetical protein n=1 Tax=Pseudofrankia saprophytica TaxID=298655 RepID=UPI001E32939A|nr:hypothetical protein [Pseudofrankia saprophytica]
MRVGVGQRSGSTSTSGAKQTDPDDRRRTVVSLPSNPKLDEVRARVFGPLGVDMGR